MTDSTTEDSATDQRPLLRVVNANATPEEIAAIVAVFSSLGGGEAPAPKPRREWNAPHRMARRPVNPGRGAWKASGLPL